MIQETETNQLVCKVCNAKNIKLDFIKSGIKFRKCKECNFVFVYPLPSIETQQKYYDSSYQEGGYRLYQESQELRIKLNTKRFDDLAEYSLKGNILDIGCGAGFFLDVASKNGLNTFGIELSSEATKKTKLRHPNVFNGTLEDAKYPDGFFDIITIFDLIEHVMDPNQTIKEVNRILNPGGLAVFTTPDISSWHAKVLKKNWYQINPLQHLYYFSPKTMTMILKKNNFEILKIEKNFKIFRIDDIIKMMEFYYPSLYKIVRFFKPILSKKFLLKERLFYFSEIYVIAKKI